MNLAFITTSKGRLHHVRETLPLLAAGGARQVILVDYGCPERTGDWVEANLPGVEVVRVQDDPGFCLARARNIGARHARAAWLAFIDADIRVSPGWCEWMRANLAPGRFYRAGPVDGVRVPDAYGSCVCSRQAFVASGGYDEAFRGWGGEDVEFYARLAQLGQAEADYPGALVSAITHADVQRTGWFEIKDRGVQAVVNQCYTQAKLQMMAFNGFKRPLSLAQREKLMRQTVEQVTAWNGDPAKPLPVLQYTLKGPGWLPPPYLLEREVTITLRVAPNGAPGQPPQQAPR